MSNRFFTEQMIAPCGLDCSLCTQAHLTTNACPGCLGPNEHKPEFCSARCDIIRCEQRKKHQYRFCDECPEYPCKHSLERETRYASQYALKESPLTNLREIRQKGMKEFLREEQKRWTCQDCGGVISVHEGVCCGCGRKYDSLS